MSSTESSAFKVVRSSPGCWLSASRQFRPILRLFCFITKNRQGRPLTGYQTVVNLIARTTTKTGLKVQAAIDENNYETGIEVRDEQLARVNITPASFHGDWNYIVSPDQ